LPSSDTTEPVQPLHPSSPQSSSIDQVAQGQGARDQSGTQPGRWNRGVWLFRDSTLQKLEFLLDEAFRIPGTQVRFGIDGVVGIIPGFGDVVAGLLSLVIPLAAWIRGLPYITLIRMLVNLAIGVLVGSIPLFGDIFDIAWKTNRRNYRLLTRHLSEPRRHTAGDWLFLLSLACAATLVFAIPVLFILWLFAWFLGRL
jgi:Domain of unknown function (DUF4112)